jgi:NtrC-family two-component system response regulator AlgB
LVVDDERNIREHLRTFLRGLGHDVTLAADGGAALALLDAHPVDLVLSDVRMAGVDGMALRRRRPDALVVLMTAYGTIQGAVDAMREGAYDYVVKPFSLDEMGLLIDRALEVQGLRRENRALRAASAAPAALLESRNAAMGRVLDTARRAAGSDVTVLLGGESGTGKNVLAQAIHDWSPRAGRPFVTIACTTLTEQLLASELFGHVKGAFTGAWKDKPGRIEAAADGTVFLDEVGELSSELQAKLLRFLEERRFEPVGSAETRTVDVRIIAATNRDLAAEVATGRFRRDLFFRLNVIALHLPALRERGEDLEPLVDHLLASLLARYRRRDLRLDQAARTAILGYPWPGNVRELVNALERAIVLARDETIRRDDLPDAVLAPVPAAAPDGAPGARSLEDVERRHVQTVLAESATLEEAAARLGINVTTLWRKRRRWGLD